MQLTVSLKVEVPASATIPDLEQVIQAAGQQAMRMALGEAVRAYEAQHQTCPHCGNQCSVGRALTVGCCEPSLGGWSWRPDGCAVLAVDAGSALPMAA